MEKIKVNFISLRRTIIDNALIEYGFKEYRATSLARVTEGNILQCIYFHKYRFGGQFKVIVAARPLFCQNEEDLDHHPGNSLLRMSTNTKDDRWWISSDDSVTKKSLEEVLKLINKYAMPFFDAMTNSRDILKTKKKNILGLSRFGGRIDWGPAGYEEFDLGHIYLESRNIRNAIANFNISYKEFKKDKRDWAHANASKCLEILQIIEMGQVFIDAYVQNTIRDSKHKLKLTNW